MWISLWDSLEKIQNAWGVVIMLHRTPGLPAAVVVACWMCMNALFSISLCVEDRQSEREVGNKAYYTTLITSCNPRSLLLLFTLPHHTYMQTCVRIKQKRKKVGKWIWQRLWRVSEYALNRQKSTVESLDLGQNLLFFLFFLQMQNLTRFQRGTHHQEQQQPKYACITTRFAFSLPFLLFCI